MRGRTLRWTVWGILLTAGCSSAPNDPEAEYRSALRAVYSGDLATAYQRLCPPSYDRDLNRLLEKARLLIDSKSYREGLELVGDLAGLLAPDADSTDAWTREFSRVLSDLPAHSGLGDHSDFRGSTVRTALQRFQEGQLWAALRHRDSPIQVSRQWLVLEKLQGEEADMRVIPTPENQPPRIVRLVRIEGKWLPERLVKSWDRRIEAADRILDGWLEEKKRDPEFLRKRIAFLRARAFEVALTVAAFLQQLAPNDPVASR